MASQFPLSFRNDTLRKHRRKVLFEREKAMLPTMVVFVEAKKNIERANGLFLEADINLQLHHAKYREIRRRLDDIYPRYQALRLKREDGTLIDEAEVKEYRQVRAAVKDIREEEKQFAEHELNPAHRAVQTLRREIARWHRMYDTGVDSGASEAEAKEKRQFIMRCPAEGCRGFLSQAYQCGVCDKKTCSDCLELLADNTEHTCKPETVESAKAIKKETRPCPKCGARIFKIDGCDQMYCTMEGCGTAFSWNTGQIATGRIHNPHYYEWLRRNGGAGGAPREAGDIPCGGIPVTWAYTRAIIQYEHLTTEQKNLLLEIHRNMVEFESRLREYPATRPAVANKENNVRYLMNQMTEAEWQRQLELCEAKFNRKREIGQILQTLVSAGAETLQGIMERIQQDKAGGFAARSNSAAIWIRESALPMLESLRVYTNDAYKTLAVAQHMAVPQISERWVWQGIRALYRASAGAGTKSTADTDDAKVADADHLLDMLNAGLRATSPPPLVDAEAV